MASATYERAFPRSACSGRGAATTAAALLLAVLLVSPAARLPAQEPGGRAGVPRELPFPIPRVGVTRLDLGPAAFPAEAYENAARKLRERRSRAGAGVARQDKPGEAMAFFLEKRLPRGAVELPVEKYLAARAHARRMRRHAAALGRAVSTAEAKKIDTAVAAASAPIPALGTWVPLGPGNVGGRTRALVIDPRNPAVMYAGGVSGGVWKTTNAGSSWSPVGDLLANIAVASLAMDPGDSGIVYAGTGEVLTANGAQVPVRGAGIFKTTDAGLSWTQLPGTLGPDFQYVSDLVASPGNAGHVYAATRTGVWKSSDGGTTWAPSLGGAARYGCTDLAIRGGVAGDALLAACAVAGSESDVVHRTLDGGRNWEGVLTAASMGRTAVAFAPSDPSVAYALASDRSREGGPLLDVYRSAAAGAFGTWTPRVDKTVKLNNQLLTNTWFAHRSDCGLGPDEPYSQGDYDIVIAVDPLDSSRVWAGGIDLFRSDDGGANWGLASNWIAPVTFSEYVHADQHAIVFHPAYDGAGNRQMFVGNDGGIFRTGDARGSTATGVRAPCGPFSGPSWTSLNRNYGVTQFYHGVPYPDGTRYFGGTQDNGTIRGSSAGGINGWGAIKGGDGGAVAVHPTLTNRLYAENYSLSIARSEDGGASWTPAVAGIFEPDESFLFIVPFILDSANPEILWTGGFYLWRTTDGARGWSRASALTAGSGKVSAIANAPGNSNVVVVGMSDGTILRNQAALSAGPLTVWPSVKPRDGFVSSVAFDPSNPRIVYATYSTFGGGHLWKSVDAGATFTDVSGSGFTGLPDVPAHAVVVDPRDPATLFIGTDLGVFVSRDGGASWYVEQTGFANVITESLSLNEAGGRTHVYAFTHGRGAWKVALLPPPRGGIDTDGDGIPNGVEVGDGTAVTRKDNDVFANPRLFAKQQFRDFLGREGDAEGVDFWARAVDSGALSRARAIESFLESPEFQLATAPIARLYLAAFLRPPDDGGLSFWLDRRRAGTPLAVIAREFTASGEFQARYGSLADGEFVELVYRNVLGRLPEPAGRDYWVRRLAEGLPRGDLLVGFSESDEYRRLSRARVYVSQLYAGMLGREADREGYAFWVSALERGASGLGLIDAFLRSQEYRDRFL